MPRRLSAQGSFAPSVQPLNRRKQPDIPHLFRYATRVDESCREANLLIGAPLAAATSVGRFVNSSTVGIAGLFDVAGALGPGEVVKWMRTHLNRD